METRACRGAVRARGAPLLLLLVVVVMVVSLVHIEGGPFVVVQDSAATVRSVEEALDLEPDLANTESMQSPVVTPATVHNTSDLNAVLEMQTGHCKRLAELGGTWYCQGFDGNKDVCFDPWFQPVFNSCIAYSFGVGHDISFEYALVDVWGCNIHMHDYTINDTRHKFYERHLFKQQGIASRSFVGYGGHEFVTYRDALAANGHLDDQIHYLKLDIEGAEYEILPGMIASGLLKNVWQLHMEVHSWMTDTTQWLRDMQRSYAIIRQLEDSGFRRVRTTVNNLVKYNEVTSGIPGCCNDVLWINTNRIPAHAVQDGRILEGPQTWTAPLHKY